MAAYDFASLDAARIYLIVYSVVSILGWSYVLVLIFVHLLNLDGISDTIGTKAHQRGLSLTGKKFVGPSLQALTLRSTTFRSTTIALTVEKGYVVSVFVILKVL